VFYIDFSFVLFYDKLGCVRNYSTFCAVSYDCKVVLGLVQLRNNHISFFLLKRLKHYTLACLGWDDKRSATLRKMIFLFNVDV